MVLLDGDWWCRGGARRGGHGVVVVLAVGLVVGTVEGEARTEYGARGRVTLASARGTQAEEPAVALALRASCGSDGPYCLPHQ